MASSEKSYWLKSGMYSIFEKLSALVFGIGSFWMMLQLLSRDEVGTWALFLVIVQFAEVSRSGLLQNALVKHLTTSEGEEYKKINTASLFLNVFLSFLFSLILFNIGGYVANLWDAPDLATMVKIYAVGILLLIFFYQSNFIQQANLDFQGIFWATFFKQGTLFFYILYIYITKQDLTLINVAIVFALTGLVGSFVSVIFGRKYFRFSKSIDWDWVKKLWHYGKYVCGTNLSAMLYKRIDIMMLGILLNKGSVALYELCIRITNFVEVPTLSMASIVFPQSARKMVSEGKGAVKEIYERSVGAILAIILPVLIFAFLFPEFIITIFNKDYLDAVPVLRLTLMFGFFVPFSIQFGTVLDSIGKPRINFMFVLFGSLLNVIFNYLFISNFGLKGAAYGTLTTYFIMFCCNQMILYKMFNIKAWRTIPYAIQFYRDGTKMALDFIKNRNNPNMGGDNVTEDNPVEESIAFIKSDKN